MDGEVDITLIDAMLELTPEQRILQNDRALALIDELRDGLARAMIVELERARRMLPVLEAALARLRDG